ncbi:hypothetical protein OIDMADRAFT_60579 [Oidiodendron maius Zn]|uniref:Uncharacterized protein n=1 Tax=Oidiodendron maius (strain Zn) TaxID=913774 RepID=A0A0C3GWZ3_OIDMZ|nr:hypothetical protein OIDMADRAFT_60579 [Oidiodendron maius Zn]
MEANVNDFQISCPGIERQIADVPEQFENVEDALPRLQILLNQVFNLYQNAEVHHETHIWVASQISPPLQPEYEAICAKYEAWVKAISRTESLVQNGDRRQRAGHLLLKIFASSLEIDLYVFVHGEATYDTLKETNFGILSLIETFLEIHSDTTGMKGSNNEQDKTLSPFCESLSFTSSPQVVPVLFEIATRTGDPNLRQRALELLRFSSRREGVWDSRVAASLAEKIVQLKQQGIVAAENHNIGRKFLITDILLLSEQKCMVRFGFKRAETGSFNSFWLETIHPGQGLLQSQILTIT